MLSVSVYYDVYSSDFMIVDDASWPLFSCLHGQDTLCLPLASQRMETVCFYFTFSPHIDHNVDLKSYFEEDIVLTRLDMTVVIRFMIAAREISPALLKE